MKEHTLVRDERTWNMRCSTCGVEAAFGWLPDNCVPHEVREAAYQKARGAGADHWEALDAYARGAA